MVVAASGDFTDPGAALAAGRWHRPSLSACPFRNHDARLPAGWQPEKHRHLPFSVSSSQRHELVRHAHAGFGRKQPSLTGGAGRHPWNVQNRQLPGIAQRRPGRHDQLIRLPHP